MVVTCLLILSQFSVAGNGPYLKPEWLLPSHEELIELEKQALRDSEGLVLTAYPSHNPKYIGYGMHLRWNGGKTTITEPRAEFLLDKLFRKFYELSLKTYPNSTTHYANARMIYARGLAGSRAIINQSSGNILPDKLLATANKFSSHHYASAIQTIERIKYANRPRLNVKLIREPFPTRTDVRIFAEPKDGLQIIWPVPQSLLTKPLIINTLTNQSYVRQKNKTSRESQCPISSTSNCQSCTSTKRSRKCGSKGNGSTRKPSRSGR